MWHRTVLIVSAVAGSWLLMQVVHELGHVVGAAITRGRVVHVELHPLGISRTDIDPNPQPLVAAWAGPVVGSLVPLAIWAAAAPLRWEGAFLLRFFAGFCLLANGLYLGVGSFGRIGDAGDILSHGSPVWTLWLFGLATAPAGLWLWNGLGPQFGIGAASAGATAAPVRPGLAYATLAAAILTAAAMWLWSSL
jgi:hypothetical protein